MYNIYICILSQGEWKCKAFYSLKVALEGFEKDLKSKMVKYLDEMDGCLVESDDPHVTHIVRIVRFVSTNVYFGNHAISISSIHF